MSLLRCTKLPRVAHPTRVLGGIAFNSTASKPPKPEDSTSEFLDFLSSTGTVQAQPSTGIDAILSPLPEEPPVNPHEPPPRAPEGGYPPPNPPSTANPLRNLGSWAQIHARATPGRENPIYNVHVQATKRNTIATFTKPNGDVITTYTGGNVGFRKGNRSSYEAGFQCAARTFEAVRKEMERTGGLMGVHLYLSGFGNGRESVVRALMASEGDDVRKTIIRVTDKTPIKIGGTRAMKARRL